MSWLWYGGGALAGLIALVALVGACLPRNHTATRSARFRKPAEEVFRWISGPQDWRPEVAKWEQTGPGLYVETDKRGDKIRFEVVESVPPVRRVTRIADPGLPFGGTWTWELSPEGAGGCRVRVTEDGFVGNVIFRFVSRFVMGHHSTMETYLRSLAGQLGENITIEE
jgi:hypothetical protein